LIAEISFCDQFIIKLGQMEIKFLGTGAQATVMLCCEQQSSSSSSPSSSSSFELLFAKKTFHKLEWTKIYLQRELSILQQLRHQPFIAQLSCVQVPEEMKSQSIFLHYYCNGDLCGLLADLGSLEEKLARTLFRMCIIGVDICHQHRIIHGDLKPENIFLDENYIPHIGDFSVCRSCAEEGNNNNNNSPSSSFSSGKDFMRDEFHGTKDYMAPEVLQNQRKTSIVQYNGVKADVWSLGCLLFVMVTGFHPFGEKGACMEDFYYKKYIMNREQFWKLHQKNRSPGFSKEFRKLVERFLMVDPARRPSLTDALLDPWFIGGSSSTSTSISTSSSVLPAKPNTLHMTNVTSPTSNIHATSTTSVSTSLLYEVTELRRVVDLVKHMKLHQQDSSMLSSSSATATATVDSTTCCISGGKDPSSSTVSMVEIDAMEPSSSSESVVKQTGIVSAT